MPNWCMNTLNVSGGADEIKRFVFANQGLPAKYPPQEWEKAIAQMEPQPTESYFCFNALVPTPQEVLDMGYDAHNKISKDTLLFALHGQSISPIDGYHWNIANWGTKWDVYHDKITPDEMGWSEGCEGIEFEFDTAWSRRETGLSRFALCFLPYTLRFTMKNLAATLPAISYGKTANLLRWNIANSNARKHLPG